jgi:hypothetical protein
MLGAPGSDDDGVLEYYSYHGCLLHFEVLASEQCPPPPKVSDSVNFFRNRYHIEALSHIFFILAFLVNLSNVFLPSEFFCSNIYIYLLRRYYRTFVVNFFTNFIWFLEGYAVCMDVAV